MKTFSRKGGCLDKRSLWEDKFTILEYLETCQIELDLFRMTQRSRGGLIEDI